MQQRLFNSQCGVPHFWECLHILDLQILRFHPVPIYSRAFVVVIVWWLDLQLHMQLLPITTKVVSLNPVQGEVYSIQHYVIKFVSDLWQVGGFLWFPPPIKLIAMILLKLLKVAFNILTQTKPQGRPKKKQNKKLYNRLFSQSKSPLELSQFSRLWRLSRMQMGFLSKTDLKDI